MKTLITLAALVLTVAAPLALATTQDPAEASATAKATDAAAKTDDEIIAEQLPSYPAGPCLVSGEEMGGEHGEIMNVVHEGRLFRLCCKSCKKMLAKTPDEYIAALDAAIIQEQLPSYPLETCVISGHPLDTMGEPINMVLGTRLVRLCCEGCDKKVANAPGKALEEINAALIEKQSADYPLETCPVSGEALGSMGDAIDYLYGYRLVKLCCKGCVRGIQKKPAEIVAKLDAARAAAR